MGISTNTSVCAYICGYMRMYACVYGHADITHTHTYTHKCKQTHTRTYTDLGTFFLPCTHAYTYTRQEWHCCSVLQCVAVCCSVLQCTCMHVHTQRLTHMHTTASHTPCHTRIHTHLHTHAHTITPTQLTQIERTTNRLEKK